MFSTCCLAEVIDFRGGCRPHSRPVLTGLQARATIAWPNVLHSQEAEPGALCRLSNSSWSGKYEHAVLMVAQAGLLAASDRGYDFH
jgi:hypothetical protein